MSIQKWWDNEKSKAKSLKKTIIKWVGIALAVIVGALVLYGIVILVKNHKQNAEAAALEAQAAALTGGGLPRVTRRAYLAPLEGSGWRLRGGQRVVPVIP